MGRVIGMNHVTLDGVTEGRGRPEEDTRDGIAHDGWAVAFSTPKLTDSISTTTGVLIATYERTAR